VILWWLDARLALVTFTLVPALFLLSVFYRGRIRGAYRDVRRRIARINGYLQEEISGMLLVQLFRREGEDRREFDAINRGHRDAVVLSGRRRKGATGAHRVRPGPFLLPAAGGRYGDPARRQLQGAPRGEGRRGRGHRGRQDDAREAPHPAVRPDRGGHPPRRRRHP